MTDLRTQGRPRASERQFGRERLLEKTRLAMNRPPRIELQRRDIAEIAGVTPALVNYYFPDKWEMLEAAALPIIEAYHSQVISLLEGEGDRRHKIRKLIHIYFTFNSESGSLLDYYIEAMRQRQNVNGISILWGAHARIVSYLSESMPSQGFDETLPELLNALLWGVCKYVAQHSKDRIETLFPVTAEADPMIYRADVIYELLINGLRLHNHGLDAV